MSDSRYGEVKTRKNFFPKDAHDIVKRGTVGILISQCKVSNKTKEILSEADVTLYENVEPSEVDALREKIREEIREKLVEKKELGEKE